MLLHNLPVNPQNILEHLIISNKVPLLDTPQMVLMEVKIGFVGKPSSPADHIIHKDFAGKHPILDF